MGFEHAVENAQGAWIAARQGVEGRDTARITVDQLNHLFARLTAMLGAYAQAAHDFVVTQAAQRLNPEKIVEGRCLVVRRFRVTRCCGDQDRTAASLQVVSQRPLVAGRQTGQQSIEIVDEQHRPPADVRAVLVECLFGRLAILVFALERLARRMPVPGGFKLGDFCLWRLFVFTDFHQ